MTKDTFMDALVVSLVIGVGAGWNPGCSAAALASILVYQLVDKYFTATLHDETRSSLAALKTDFAKIKSRQDQEGLKAAFGGKSG